MAQKLVELADSIEILLLNGVAYTALLFLGLCCIPGNLTVFRLTNLQLHGVAAEKTLRFTTILNCCILQIVLLPGNNGQKLSQKLAESVVQTYTQQLQIQERLTHQIATRLCAELHPAGVLVLCKASHMCMVARGVEQHASSTITVAAYGIFELDHVLRSQVVHRLRARRGNMQQTRK